LRQPSGLAVYVGADPSDSQRVEPILAPLGMLHHVGGPGAGAAAKVVVNAAIAAFGAALALGDALRLDRSVLLVDEIADRAGRRLEVAATPRGWLERAAQAGAGDLDYSAAIATITGDGGPSPA
jgi:3-hydroxyisobutyrate dehydrogenase-like beta-hydroxyacid dehydrogenase